MNLEHIELPSNRRFGLFITFVFLLAGVFFYRKSFPIFSFLSFAIGILFLVFALMNSDLLQPLNRLWIRFGLAMGMIVSPIVLGVFFFGIFTPIAIYMRLIGRDELRLKLKHRASYWKEKNGDTVLPNSFNNQF